MVALNEYLALRETPPGKIVMRQRWRDLLFLHFSCEPEVIQASLPEGLTVDTFPDAEGNERAWVGLVPFRMEGVRPEGLPSVRWLSDFPETNVRTYVHREGKEPGVWFYSLDAANDLACKIARRFFSLPYFHAQMTVEREEDQIRYESVRLKEGAFARVTASLQTLRGSTKPGTLEFFLVERYLLYSLRNQVLFSGRVHHPPYELCAATLEACDESLIEAAGLFGHPFVHTCFSEGVDVQVYGLRSLGSFSNSRSRSPLAGSADSISQLSQSARVQ